MEFTNGGGGNKDQNFLAKLKKEVDDNLTNDQYSVEELAKNIGMSRSQLHRKLISATGQSVSQFIREYRLQRGMELLKIGELTAAEVADRIGFGSATYFNKCFNEYYGFPPGEAKNKIIESPESLPVEKTFNPPGTAPHRSSQKNSFLFLKVIGGLVLGIGIIYLFYAYRSAQTPKNKSIAILPFKNLSEDQQNEYFSEGIIEAIRTNLSQVSALHVISRTSVEQYRESKKPAREISNELGVATLLEGSVQRNNDEVRIEVRLIDGTTEGQLWSETYDRKLQDVFAIQSEIAQEVAKELNAKLSPEEKSKLLHTDTENSEAYDLYLKGI